MKCKRVLTAVMFIALAFCLVTTTVPTDSDAITTNEASLSYNGGDAIEYATLSEALLKCNTESPGNYKVTLLKEINNISNPFVVEQREGTNIIIDGGGNNFTGQIVVDGNARFYDNETLDIRNIKFKGELGSLSHYYIECNARGGYDAYAHNVTITNCTFTMPLGDTTYGAIKFAQSNNIVVEGCVMTGGAIAFWGTGNTDLKFSGLTINNVAEGGLSVGTSNGDILIENSKIAGARYAIRADANIGDTNTANMTVSNVDMDAKVPVSIRYSSDGTYNIDFANNNTVREQNLNPLGYWIVSSDAEYKGTEGETPSDNGVVNVTATSSVPKFIHEHDKSCTGAICSGCGQFVTEHTWDSPFSCLATECTVCHTPYPNRTTHTSDAAFDCVAGNCSICNTPMPAEDEHNYEVQGFHKICTVCGDAVNLPIQDDEEDDFIPTAPSTGSGDSGDGDDTTLYVACVAAAAVVAVLAILALTTNRN